MLTPPFVRDMDSSPILSTIYSWLCFFSLLIVSSKLWLEIVGTDIYLNSSSCLILGWSLPVIVTSVVSNYFFFTLWQGLHSFNAVVALEVFIPLAVVTFVTVNWYSDSLNIESGGQISIQPVQIGGVAIYLGLLLDLMLVGSENAKPRIEFRGDKPRVLNQKFGFCVHG